MYRIIMPEENKPATIPHLDLMSNIQLEDVRLFMLDNLTSTNVLGTNYYFSNDEIMQAMRRAIDAYNAVPPLCISIQRHGVKLNHIFLNGIAWQLCLSKMMQLQRQDVNYSSGGTQVDLVAKQIQHLATVMQMFKQEFETRVREQKRSANARNAFKSF